MLFVFEVADDFLGYFIIAYSKICIIFIELFYYKNNIRLNIV